MAREKRDKPAGVAIDLLGEAFGVQSRIAHKRTKSLNEAPPTPLMIGGVPYIAPEQVLHSTPIPPQGFPGLLATGLMQMQQFPQQQFPSQNMLYQQTQVQPTYYFPPARFSVGSPKKPTVDDFEQLKNIDADYNSKHKAHTLTNSTPMAQTTTVITQHTCANCGRLRSRKYQHENPIKPGETPVMAFCRKCQKDASSTEESEGTKKSTKIQNTKQKLKVAIYSCLPHCTSLTLVEDESGC